MKSLALHSGRSRSRLAMFNRREVSDTSLRYHDLMPNDAFAYDVDGAIARLIRYLGIEGVTGQEKLIANAIAEDLAAAGVPKKDIGFDDAHERIPLPTETGNLIAKLEGTLPGPRLLFMTHLDTVPLCAGAQPVKKGNRIVATGQTALGGDNRTGVAVLVTLAKTLIERKLPHPPLTFLFTVREESGLWGARFVKAEALGNPVMAFNVDGRSACRHDHRAPSGAEPLGGGYPGRRRTRACIRSRASPPPPPRRWPSLKSTAAAGSAR